MLLLVGVLVLVLAALVRPQLADARSTRVSLVEQIDDYRAETWRWQKLMRAPRTRTSYSERKIDSGTYRAWVRDLWHKRALAAERRAASPPHRSQWLCIHRHERHPLQGWATQTGNGYYGGLQMDISFQRTYGSEILRRKGTANNWSALEQMWVAERAHRSGRGFQPWPNTARSCGLT
ncbi:MAG: transglycosylase family protein [Gaiellaceae bacterium MAG52_C11]|nr:transglycosylase family protein [Candidatus Gaiellasilicea maunaloa]